MSVVKGYIGNLSVERAQKLAGQGVYVVNAMCVGSKEHLKYAYLRTQENFDTGNNVARNFHFELMRILSGRRQIKDAVALCGTTDAKALAAISESDFELDKERDDSVIDCTPKKLKYLQIEGVVPGKECDAFFENSALLFIQK